MPIYVPDNGTLKKINPFIPYNNNLCNGDIYAPINGVLKKVYSHVRCVIPDLINPTDGFFETYIISLNNVKEISFSLMQSKEDKDANNFIEICIRPPEYKYSGGREKLSYRHSDSMGFIINMKQVGQNPYYVYKSRMQLGVPKSIKYTYTNDGKTVSAYLDDEIVLTNTYSQDMSSIGEINVSCTSKYITLSHFTIK